MDVQASLDQILRKTKRLLSRQQELEKEKDQLKTENQRLKKELEDYKNRLKELENKNVNLHLARSLKEDKDYTKISKRIEGFIHEIDRCIELLESQ